MKSPSCDSGAYRRALVAGGCAAVREDPIAVPRQAGELEIQARWFAGELGCKWETADGETVEVVEFGTWNREAGPDFTGVLLRFERSGEMCRGDVEIDTDVRDWDRHGHATNPAFRSTRLHCFFNAPQQRFFTRTLDHCEVPQVLLRLPDSESYPEREHAAWITDDAHEASRILYAAARHRLNEKGDLLTLKSKLLGEEAAWFQAIATGLGYKRNAIPFLLLAQRAGRRAAGSPGGEAWLFGLAGFLEGPVEVADDADARKFLRDLWEGWWAARAEVERLILPSSAWTFAGVRPANHPHRRTGALAAIARGWRSVSDSMKRGDRSGFRTALTELAHPFWSHRYNLRGAVLNRSCALVGSQRITDLMLNIFYPLTARNSETCWNAFTNERGPKVERTIRSHAARFFGELSSDRVLLRSAVHQQGLIQLAKDFERASDPSAFVQSLRSMGR